MTKPLVQIDDEIREMTDEEYEAYLEEQKNSGASAGIVD
jgi:ribosomal protein L29